MKKILFISFFVLYLQTLFAQDVDKAFKYFDIGKYEQAALEFEKILPIVESSFGAHDTNYYTLYIVFTAYSFDLCQQKDKAEYYFLKAKGIFEFNNAFNNTDYIQVLHNLSFLYKSIGEYKKAEPLFLQILEIKKKTYGEDNLEYVIALNNLGSLYLNMGNYSMSEKAYQRSLEINEKLFGKDHLDYATSLNNLAVVYQSMGNYQKAEPLCLKDLEITEKILGKKDPHYATSLSNLALLYESMGEYKRAEPICIEALEIKRQTIGNKHPDYATSLNNLASLNVSMGKYQKAEPLYLEALEIQKATIGERHPDYIRTLSNLAQLYNSIGNYPKSEIYYLQVLEIRKNSIGEEHPDYAVSLNNLGSLYTDMGRYLEAEKLYLQAMEITKKATGEENSTYTMILNNLAGLYKSTGSYKKAEPLLLQSIEIRKRLLGQNHPDYASSLNNLATFYMEMGDYKNAEQLFLKVLAIRKTTLGEEHLDYASSLNNLALLYFKMGQYHKTETLYFQSISILKKSVGTEHSYYLSSLDNLAQFYQATGNYQKAETLFLQVIEMREKTLFKDHPDNARSLNNLAQLYVSIGKYQQAEVLLIDACEIFKNTLGEDSPIYATSINNLGSFYLKMGNYEKAESFSLAASSIARNSVGEEHPDYARALNNLAQAYYRLGKDTEAEKLYKLSLQIFENTYGEFHPEYAMTLNNLAILYESMGNFKMAEPLYLQALDIRRSVFGEAHIEYAQALNNLALFYTKSGEFLKSEPMYVQALTIFKKALGENHPDYATAMNNLAGMYFDSGRNNEAEPLFKQSTAIMAHNIQQDFGFLSEAEKEKYVVSCIESFKAYQSFCIYQQINNPAISAEAFDIELAIKGIILGSGINMRNIVKQSNDTSVENIYNQWTCIKELLATQYSLPASGRISNLDSIENQANILEKNLTKYASLLQGSQLLLSIGCKDVQKNLKPGEASIEFTQFRYRSANKWSDSLMYVALVLRKEDKYPHMIPLCEARQLNILLQKGGTTDAGFIGQLYRGSQIISSEKQFSYGHRLYQLIWQPLDSLLQGIEKVYYAPTSILHQIAFAAIPHKDGMLLSDKYTLTQLSSAALLAIEPQVFDSQPKSLALFGGIKYDTKIDQLLANSKKYITQSPEPLFVASRSLPDDLQRSGDWNYLEGTRSEVEAIASIANKKGKQTQLFTGNDAVEEAFKSLGGKQSPQVIHIATHGFFFPDPQKEKPDDRLDFSQSERQRTIHESDNPLNRAGLLFAGAENAWSGKEIPQVMDDGILTAYEVSNVSLPTTQLVVLSACETGLGDIKGSEGVYGLQRAFKAAGAQYIIMSLWKVPDAETSEFMQLFYSTWFTGKTIPDAFTATQNLMKTKYKDEPYKWAAFVLVR